MNLSELSVCQLRALIGLGGYTIVVDPRQPGSLAHCDNVEPARLIVLLPRIANLEELLYAMVRKAQEILTNRLQPEGPSSEETLGELYELFDGGDWRLAEELRSRISDEMRAIAVKDLQT